MKIKVLIYSLFISVLIPILISANVTGNFKFITSSNLKSYNYKNGPIYLQVEDADKNVSQGIDTVDVFIRSQTELTWLMIPLIETEINSGVFTGFVAVDSVGNASNDNKLQVRVGDIIFGEYRDISNDNGQMQVIKESTSYGFTEIPGAIYTTNTLWKKEFSPYLITGDINVINGAIIRIEAGTEIRILAGCDKRSSGRNPLLTEIGVSFGSKLIAIGNKKDSIKFFLQSQDTRPGGWDGLKVTDYAKGEIDYVLIENAVCGVFYEKVDNGSKISNSNIRQFKENGIKVFDNRFAKIDILNNRIFSDEDSIKNCIYLHKVDTMVVIKANKLNGVNSKDVGINIYECSARIIENEITHFYEGLRIFGKLPDLPVNKVIRNTIKYNDTGIYMDYDGNAIINYNNLHDNINIGINNYTPLEIDAKFNWWGYGVTALMNAEGNQKNLTYLIDHFDTEGLGTINYQGWLDSPLLIGLNTPELISPISNSRYTSALITFKWKKVLNAQRYKLEIFSNTDTNNIVFRDTTIVDTSLTISELPFFRNYTFRVRAVNNEGESEWSERREFNTGMTSELSWSLKLNVYSKDDTDLSIATFGMHPNATDAIDEELGEYLLPPNPPLENPFAKFVVLTNEGSFIDLRNSEILETDWTLNFQPSEQGYPIKITWDSNQLPKGSFKIYYQLDGKEEIVNMKRKCQVIINDPEINTIMIHYKNEITIKKMYNAGWNMLSAPVAMEKRNVKNYFHNMVSQLFSFNSRYAIDSLFTNGVGYWLRLSNKDSVTYIGQEVTGSISLNKGWNLLGGMDKSLQVTNIETTPSGILASTFFEFENGYRIATELTPGMGYWVKINENGELNLPQSILKVREEFEIPNDWNKIIVSDASGTQGELYISNTEINAERFELPPLPPADVFDVRFSTGNYVENSKLNKTILIQSGNFPIKIKSMNRELRISYFGENGIYSNVLKKSEEITILDKSVERIQISETEIPTEFNLMQNYPNPFNPTTTIKFALPNNSKVNLSVYNILGEKVIDLIDKELEAGNHEVIWNADKLSSGIYIYRIYAGQYSEIGRAHV